MNAENIELRKKLIRNCHRIVVKAGTRLLTDPESLPVLIGQIKTIRDAGKQVILVSSGAVGIGMKILKLKKRPRRLSEVQALAALGQGKLMAMYEAECEKLGFRCAQILLTADDLRSRERHLNALNCIETLLSQDILPIINENDPVSVDELKFGDNDILASLLASMTRADLTIILTTVDGLKKPNEDGTLGDRISVVRGITDTQRAMATGTDDGNMSIGGMTSKLKAADTLNSAGEALWLASGRDSDILGRRDDFPAGEREEENGVQEALALDVLPFQRKARDRRRRGGGAQEKRVQSAGVRHFCRERRVRTRRRA